MSKNAQIAPKYLRSPLFRDFLLLVPVVGLELTQKIPKHQEILVSFQIGLSFRGRFEKFRYFFSFLILSRCRQLDICLVHCRVIAPAAPGHQLSFRDLQIVTKGRKRPSQAMTAYYSHSCGLTSPFNVIQQHGRVIAHHRARIACSGP